ncbi:MAG TPA: family 43 glycosylhydrolase, partial [Polyangiaceae bacterium]
MLVIAGLSLGWVAACSHSAGSQSGAPANDAGSAGSGLSSSGGNAGSATAGGAGGSANASGANAGSGAQSTGGAGANAGGTSSAGTSSAGTAAAGTAAGGASGASGAVGQAGASGTSGSGAGGTSGASGSGTGGGADVVTQFHNGVFWNDTAGARIEAHGAGLLKVGDSWYWFGEDKSQNSGLFKAVNCYASKNLADWEARGAVLTKASTPTLNTADRIIERPKVIYNDQTQTYVMWLHWDGQNYAAAEAGVFTSKTVDGAYTYQSAFQPNNNMSRDDTLFKDDDGTAYFLSAANNNADMGMYQLTSDYLNIQSQLTTLFVGGYREAPALFKKNGTYFLITSAATGWDPNQAQYATATSMKGPWSALENLGDGTAFDSQAAYILPVVGSQKTTYIYVSDRWQDPDLVSSKYIWLPLVSTGSSLAMDYHATWNLDLTSGQWWADDGFVPQKDWSIVYVDSEETQGEPGQAVHVFDDTPSTLWHTQYTPTAPMPPHEVQIDMGVSQSLSGFRYLPRQDTDDHGMVADYEFYVSDSVSAWGTAVATGTFANTRNETRVMFPAKTGRYIRFVALSEIQGRAWTSV